MPTVTRWGEKVWGSFKWGSLIDKVLDKVLLFAKTQAGWSNDDIQDRIDEATRYVYSQVIRAGYTASDMAKGSIIETAVILYSRYAILRDIYTGNSPSQTGTEPYEKWKENCDGILAKIVTGDMILLDDNGETVTKSGVDMVHQVLTNTPDVKRLLTMENPEQWHIDTETYADESVVGKE